MDNNIIKVDSGPSGFQIAAVYLVSLRYELLGRKGRRHSRLERKIPEHVQGELQQTLPCLLMYNISLTLKDSETQYLLLCLLWDPTDKLQMFSLSLLADGLNVLAIHAGKIHQFITDSPQVTLSTVGTSLTLPFIFNNVLKVSSLQYRLFLKCKHDNQLLKHGTYLCYIKTTQLKSIIHMSKKVSIA